MSIKQFKTLVRIEALRAATFVVTNNGGDAGNLLTEAQIFFEWLDNGKDPVIEKAE